MLSHKQRVFIEEYLQTWNASEAARRAGYSEKTAASQGQRLLKNVDIAAEIQRRVADLSVRANEGLVLLSAHARANVSELFKVHERWTEEPRSLDEIVEETTGTDEKGNPVRLYRVRCIVIDADKLTAPRFGALIRKFKDSPRDGLTVELHDSQTAIVKLLEAQGVFKQSAMASLNIDMSQLTDAQLERIANGEDPLKVLISGHSSGNAPGAS